jgi:hypothetical protein
MMLAFIVGLLMSNTAIVVLSSAGFVTSQVRRPLYLLLGVLAGAFSLLVGLVFLLELRGVLPNLDEALGFIGG